MISADKMPEAEVSLRLAIYLCRERLAASVSVAIDGAQVRVGGASVFDPVEFLNSEGWYPSVKESWRATYCSEDGRSEIGVHSKPGKGDVVAQLVNGSLLRVESKKGPLSRSRSSAEYPLIREALGQLLTIEEISDSDLLAVAVPNSSKFKELAERWRRAPLIVRLGVQILLVGRDGRVGGLQPGWRPDAGRTTNPV